MLHHGDFWAAAGREKTCDVWNRENGREVLQSTLKLLRCEGNEAFLWRQQLQNDVL